MRRRQKLGEEVETGGLAGAVGPDQCMDGAAADFQPNVLQGIEAAKFFAEAGGVKDHIRIHRLSRRFDIVAAA